MKHRLVLSALLLGAAALVAHGAILLRMSDADMVRNSTHVVMGTVTAVTPAWADPDGDGISQIWTTVEVRVDQVLKGDLRVGDTFSFRQQGGRIGDIEFQIYGMPKFVQGDQELLFLDSHLMDSAYSPLTGLAQGRWKVTTDQNGVRTAKRNFDESCFVRLDQNNRPIAEPKPSDDPEPLDDVLQRFATEIQKQADAAAQEVR
jgi:hypothetical protein